MSRDTFKIERLTHGYYVHTFSKYGSASDSAIEKAEDVVAFLLQWLGSDKLDGLLRAARLVVLQFENVKKWPTQGIEEAVKALEEELRHW